MSGRGKMLLFIAALAVGWQCASHTALNVRQQEQIQKTFTSKTYFLKYANFVGPFFAYADRWYMSERALDDRVLIESPGGKAIMPAEPFEILPMGTQVRIKEIDFPTSGALGRRKLKSPRHFTWVMVEGVEKPDSKPWVLVLTEQFKNKESFQAALAKYLVKENPRAAFSDHSPEILKAIDGKAVIKGMRWDSLQRSRGHPDRVVRKTVDGSRVETWSYSAKRTVTVKDDVVDSFQGFEPIQLAPRPKDPAPKPPEDEAADPGAKQPGH